MKYCMFFLHSVVALSLQAVQVSLSEAQMEAISIKIKGLTAKHATTLKMQLKAHLKDPRRAITVPEYQNYICGLTNNFTDEFLSSGSGSKARRSRTSENFLENNKALEDNILAFEAAVNIYALQVLSSQEKSKKKCIIQ